MVFSGIPGFAKKETIDGVSLFFGFVVPLSGSPVNVYGFSRSTGRCGIR